MDGRTLQAYYQRMFEMSFYHKYSITELENMPVFEFEIYGDLIVAALKKQQQED